MWDDILRSNRYCLPVCMETKVLKAVVGCQLSDCSFRFFVYLLYHYTTCYPGIQWWDSRPTWECSHDPCLLLVRGASSFWARKAFQKNLDSSCPYCWFVAVHLGNPSFFLIIRQKKSRMVFEIERWWKCGQRRNKGGREAGKVQESWGSWIRGGR